MSKNKVQTREHKLSVTFHHANKQIYPYVIATRTGTDLVIFCESSPPTEVTLDEAKMLIEQLQIAVEYRERKDQS